jgi:hypothetical protein
MAPKSLITFALRGSDGWDAEARPAIRINWTLVNPSGVIRQRNYTTMSDSIPFTTGAEITDKGQRFKLTMAGMGRIQLQIPIPEKDKSFLNHMKVYEFCVQTPMGVSLTLSEASGLEASEIDKRWTTDEQLNLVVRIGRAFWGIDPDAPDETVEGNGSKPDPTGKTATG